MQNAKLSEAQLNPTPRQRPAAPQGALVPSRLASMPIEPPHPREVADKLKFKTAAQYQKAVQLAERYYVQAKMAVDRRAASVKKAERQAEVDHEETATNYKRQITLVHTRHRSFLEQVHSKHRQALFQARANAQRAEEVYKESLAGLQGYGELQLRAMSLQDARNVTHALVGAYKAALGPDALGDLTVFLLHLDKTIDLARDRKTVAPLQFADALLKAVVHRHVRRAGADKEEIERLRQIAGVRSTAIQGFLGEGHADQTPEDIRSVYRAVHEWLSKAKGTPFDLALDRLKLDVDATVRRELRSLETMIQTAAQQTNRLHLLQPVAEAYRATQRVLIASEQASKSVLNAELARVDAQREKEIQLADAMVIGMDHTAAQRLAEAQRMQVEARKSVSRWSRVLDNLEEVGGVQKFFWRLTEGFDYQGFWDDLRGKQGSPLYT